mgnify:FL=1
MKLIDNATDIRISKGSVVIMTGLQGAGKTFFTEIFFDKENVICNDKIFWEQFKKSGKKDMIAQEDYQDIYDRACDVVFKKIEKYSKEKSYTVIDSATYSFNERMECLRRLKMLFKNIILIVINPNFDVIYKQFQEREKSVSSFKERIGLTIPNRLMMFANKYVLDEQIKEGSIGYKTNVTYIVRIKLQYKVI